jgi:hypothetical protein
VVETPGFTPAPLCGKEKALPCFPAKLLHGVDFLGVFVASGFYLLGCLGLASGLSKLFTAFIDVECPFGGGQVGIF